MQVTAVALGHPHFKWRDFPSNPHAQLSLHIPGLFLVGRLYAVALQGALRWTQLEMAQPAV